MGKKGTWLSAVKRAFRSPSKEKRRDKEKETVDKHVTSAPVEVPVSNVAKKKLHAFSDIAVRYQHIDFLLIGETQNEEEMEFR